MTRAPSDPIGIEASSRSRFALWLSLALSLALLAAAGPLASGAEAQAGAQAGAQNEAADLLIRRGVELMRQGEAERALALFEQAFGIVATPRAMAQMGLAAGALERWLDADRYLRRALSAETDPWIRRHQDELTGPLELVDQHLGELAIGGPTGAHVLVDDEDRGTLPLSAAIRVVAGRHRIRLMGAEGEIVSTEVEVQGGGRRELALRAPEQPVDPVGPPEPVRLPEEEGEGLSPMTTAGIVLAGVGGALILAGAITGGLALDAQAQTDAACGPDPANCAPGFERPRDQLRTLALTTDVLLPVGAAVGIAGAVLLVLPMLSGSPADEARAGEPEAAISCGPTGCMATLRGELP